MKKAYHIPKPCSEHWNEMIPDAKGRFCLSCEKPVIDFTNYSPKEIISHLQKHPKTCGRFSKNQLERLNRQAEARKLSVPKLTGLFAITALLGISAPAVAHTTSTKIEYRKDSAWKSILPKTPVNDSIIIKGNVLDEDGLPLPSANVILKGTNFGTTTDFDGNFNISIPKDELKISNTLVFSYLGFESKEVQIDVENPTLKIQMVMDEYMLMGEIVRYNIFQRIGFFFKGLFSKKQH